VAAGLALALVRPPLALAAEDSDAEALIHQGNELRKQGHDDLALPLIERAYKTAPSGRTAAQLGLAELAVDKWLDAKRLLEESLKLGGPWIEKNRSVLEGALETSRQHIGRLTVTGSPPGASVLLDGKAVAELPMRTAIELPEGRRTLIVHATGFVDFTRDLLVRGAQSEVFEVHLERPAKPVAPREPSASPQPSLASAPAEARAPTLLKQADPPSSDDRGITSKGWFWASIVGVVAAGVVVGIVLARGDSKDPMPSLGRVNGN
jgi:hypothetical protein